LYPWLELARATAPSVAIFARSRALPAFSRFRHLKQAAPPPTPENAHMLVTRPGRPGSEVLQRQRAALDAGAGALVPMGMAEIAVALDLHQSTVSRVVAGTSVDTPHGTWWLRKLFSRGFGADQVAAAALRERLARLVADEPQTAPLSDEALAAALNVDGAALARRTVAKYRGMLGIPPAHRRRRR
jgi:RNA polymerase sigma-54 factor